MELARADLDPVDPRRGHRAVRAGAGAAGRPGSTTARLPAGTRLPTVRALAGGLGLAVNTVARVYKELEADGLVATEGRRGTRVTGRVATPDAVRDARRRAGARGAPRRPHAARGHPAARGGLVTVNPPIGAA